MTLIFTPMHWHTWSTTLRVERTRFRTIYISIACPHRHRNVAILSSTVPRVSGTAILSCPLRFSVRMSYINLVSSTTSSGQSGLVVANNLRIASISVAAYEYVASSSLLNFLITLIRTAISSRSLPKSGYSRVQVGAGKKLIKSFSRVRRST